MVEWQHFDQCNAMDGSEDNKIYNNSNSEQDYNNNLKDILSEDSNNIEDNNDGSDNSNGSNDNNIE